ncbi:MAG: AAA family ATPase, partial [Ruminococcus sp.]|nr:AAA family ATPase [Ruminococcus sp.]
NCNTPAFIVELKRNESAEKAFKQIQTKDYTDALKDYKGEVILVGINYDVDKKHTCKIEKTVI